MTLKKGDNYKLLPHKEIESLKRELSSLRDGDGTSSRKLHIGVVELNRNIGKLLDIFEEAMHEIKIEEGGLDFTTKIKPIAHRLDAVEKSIGDIADVLSNVIAPQLHEIQEQLSSGTMSSLPFPAPDSSLPPPPPHSRLPPLPR